MRCSEPTTAIQYYDNRVIAERQAQTQTASSGGTNLTQQKGTYLQLDAAGNRVGEQDFSIGGTTTVASTSFGTIAQTLMRDVGSPSTTSGSQTFIIVNGYDADNRLLTNTNAATFGATTVGSSSLRSYSQSDQVLDYYTYSTLNLSGTPNDAHYTYNPDGTIAKLTNSQSGPASQTYIYDNAGNLAKLNVGTTSTYTYQYAVGRSSYLQTVIALATTGRSTTYSTQQYDPYDNLQEILQNGDAPNSGSTFETVYTNSSGQIAQKFGEIGKSTSYDSVADSLLYYGNSELGSFELSSTSTTQSGPATFSSTANFGFNFNPISDQYPALTPGAYVVQSGDTLQSIAQAVYGDSSLWYLIADTNNIRYTNDLTAGQILKLPNTVLT